MKRSAPLQFFNRFPIKKKLLFSLIPIVVLSYLIFVFTADVLSFQETKRIMNDQANSNMIQKTQILDNYFQKLQTETDYFMFDTEIQKKLLILGSTLSNEEKSQLDVNMKQYMLSTIVNYDSSVQGICVKTRNDDIYLWKMDSRDPYNQFLDRMSELESHARKLGGRMYFSYDRLADNRVTISRIIINPITKQELGLLMVDISLDFLAVTDTAASQNPTHAVLGEEGTVLYNASPLNEKQLRACVDGQTTFGTREGTYRVTRTSSAYSDWIVLGIINESDLYRNIKTIYYLQIAILAFSLLLMIGMIYFVSRAISQQFQLFIKKINRTNDVEEHALIYTNSRDEFQELANVYNKMLRRIKNLIDTIYSNEMLIKDQELLLRTAEIKALQAQIDPHFLYNTLDCINGLIELNRPADTKKTVTALANIMRMTTKGKEFLSVRENLNYINQYMFIEKMRYQDKILFLNEVPESMMDYIMPKLILQPVIENAIVHGISDLMGQGMIGLFGREEENSLIFCVKDNGVGVPQEVIDTIEQAEITKKHLEFSGSSVGLLNIQARLQLLYGPEYGISIKNLTTAGSSVTIRIPKIRGEQL